MRRVTGSDLAIVALLSSGWTRTCARFRRRHGILVHMNLGSPPYKGVGLVRHATYFNPIANRHPASKPYIAYVATQARAAVDLHVHRLLAYEEPSMGFARR